MAVILSSADNILTRQSGSDKAADSFALPSFLCDNSYNRLTYNNRIEVLPRYTDNSTAASKTFTAAGDYADPTNHSTSGQGWSYDFKVGDFAIAPGPWYNYTYDTGSGRRGGSSSPSNATALNDHGSRVSLFLELHVGDGPHPGVGTNYAHISLLIDGFGAHHHYQYSGQPVNYSQPRTLFDHSTANQNIKIAGQNYGPSYYSQIFCLGSFQSFSAANVKTIRLINHGGGPNGKSKVIVAGGCFLIHGFGGTASTQDF